MVNESDEDYANLNVALWTDEEREEDLTMLRFLSRNTSRELFKATEEEKLLEVVTQLTDFLNRDLKRLGDADADEDDIEVLYPQFFKRVKLKASTFKGAKGYRELVCIPPFILGLAMVGRVKRHYTHARWFMIGRLGRMLGEYGGVSERKWQDEAKLLIMIVFSVYWAVYDGERENPRIPCERGGAAAATTSA